MPQTAEYVTYQGLKLPPPSLGTRHGGKTDEHHVRSAKAIVEEVIKHANLTPEDRVLDVGCGLARFLIGMQATFGSFRQYTGLDVRQSAIDWSQSVLATDDGTVNFYWLNVANTRYNRRGEDVQSERHIFPVAERSFDVLTLFSVFSHMTLEDIERYLYEFERVMSETGRVYVTAFVEDDVPDWEENPPNYLRDWSGPLHCARMNKGVYERLVAEAGLQVDKFLYRNLQGRQSTYVLSRA